MTTTIYNHGSSIEQHSDGKNPCIVCGQEIRGEATFWLEINAEDSCVWAKWAGECATSQGSFPVGNACAKKFGTNVLWKVAA